MIERATSQKEMILRLFVRTKCGSRHVQSEWCLRMAQLLRKELNFLSKISAQVDKARVRIGSLRELGCRRLDGGSSICALSVTLEGSFYPRIV